MRRAARKQYVHVDPNRRVTGRCLMIAAVLHLGVVVWSLKAMMPGMSDLASSSLEQVASGQMLEAQLYSAAEALTVKPPPGQALDVDSAAKIAADDSDEADAISIAVEPSQEFVAEAAVALIHAADKPAAPNALETLARKAELLERLSSAGEVARMSGSIRAALGVDPIVTESPATDSAPRLFDFDDCLVTNATRTEANGVIEIREMMTDKRGQSIVLVTIRRAGRNGGPPIYEQQLIEPGREATLLSAGEEEFVAACARQKPFEVINRFPLLRQVHQQAVLPILDRLARE